MIAVKDNPHWSHAPDRFTPIIVDFQAPLLIQYLAHMSRSKLRLATIIVASFCLFGGGFVQVAFGEWDNTEGPYAAPALVFAQLPRSVFCGTRGMGVLRMEWDNLGWTPVNTGLGDTMVYALCALDTTTLLAGTRDHGIYKSTDRGSNWTASSIGLPISVTISSIIRRGNTVFVGTLNGVFASADSGASWRDISGDLAVRSIYCMAHDDLRLIAGTAKGIFWTSDFGTTWTDVSAGLLIDSATTSLLVFGSDLFAGTGGGVFHRSQGSASWVESDSGMYFSFVHALVRVQDNIFAGTPDGVYLSTNKGKNWYSVSDNIQHKIIFALAIQDSNIIPDQYLFAATSCCGVYERFLSQMVTSASDAPQQTSPNTVAVIRNYPNPFSTTTAIEFDAPLDHAGFLTVLNSLGQRMLSREVTPHHAGPDEIMVDGSKWPSGMYSCQLRTGTRTAFSTMRVVR